MSHKAESGGRIWPPVHKIAEKILNHREAKMCLRDREMRERERKMGERQPYRRDHETRRETEKRK